MPKRSCYASFSIGYGIDAMSGKTSRAGRARLGAIGFTVISVLLALAAAFVLAKLLKGKGLKAEDMTQIVVAKTDLGAWRSNHER